MNEIAKRNALLEKLIVQAENVTVSGWPVVISAVEIDEKLQDFTETMDILWSKLEPYILAAAVLSGAKAHVYARTKIPDLELRSVFRGLRPHTEERWICASIRNDKPESVRRILHSLLKDRLKPDVSAEDVMVANPKCIEDTATVAEAHDMMLRFNLMSLVVVRNGEAAGIVTRRDLDRAIQMDMWESSIAPFVPKSPPFVFRGTPLRFVKQLMVQNNVTKLPVIENSKAVGIITAREVMRGLRDWLPPASDDSLRLEIVQAPNGRILENTLKNLVSIRVLHILRKIGAFAKSRGISAYAVGGFVRDLLLERSNLDIDVVVTGDAPSFAESLAADLKADITTFGRFHTARLTCANLKIDFTSARREHYSQPGALPQVEAGDIKNDLSRRDFSINAMALDLSPDSFFKLVDLFGGLRDLRDGYIRILHPFSFLEDPTRMYRAVRFAERFHFKFAEDTRRAFDLALLRKAPSTLSLKRMAAEVARCFKENAPARVIEKLYSEKLMCFLHPKLLDSSMLPAHFNLIPHIIKRFAPLNESIDVESIYWIGLLAALGSREAASLLIETGMHHKRRDIIVTSIEALKDVPPKLSALDSNDCADLYFLLSPLPLEALIALSAFALDKNGVRRITFYLTKLRNTRLEIDGDDLIELGIPPGPFMRTIFDELLKERLKGNITCRKEELEHALRLFKNVRLSRP